ncbi:unnamed protein product [Closterium sp. Yama58-4]|nr:unnamed protein product [Closterium sp. Yama58-4]
MSMYASNEHFIHALFSSAASDKFSFPSTRSNSLMICIQQERERERESERERERERDEREREREREREAVAERTPPRVVVPRATSVQLTIHPLAHLLSGTLMFG